MFDRHTRAKRLMLALSATGVLALGLAAPAGAVDTVTQSVTAGTRTASVADLPFTAVAYSHSAQTATGSMTLTADDSTGSNAGWNVTILSSAFVWSAGTGGATSGTDIPAADFSLTSAAAPTMTAGQAVDATGGPMVPTTSPVGTLDTARKTVQANTTFGNGTYDQALGVSLTIPADSAAGTYTGTLTTTISAAP
jgi:hypothetical protein